jgi:hypothetical protein
MLVRGAIQEGQARKNEGRIAARHGFARAFDREPAASARAARALSRAQLKANGNTYYGNTYYGNTYYGNTYYGNTYYGNTQQLRLQDAR